ncbi:DUF2306 domain-containing protein [Amycolatopsis acidicola]|uniref:DUF2306 domain-containing protein n=1 Tax=Amycolatopsis acidicola TaxID=2596893 RepID=A0A5N0UVS7_9PSEU|nr:DUF2306 domain-containing protein [Amycolatopsis acidicola]KAA9154593.1 DUF2306 domain-containing protein [Amycolatopsis acidicola]
MTAADDRRRLLFMVTVEPKPATRSRAKIKPPLIALMMLVVAFLGYALPPYLGLDPAQARTLPPTGVSYYYPALVTHIFLGSIALLAGCLQLWPWLRERYPQVHRWSGRAYVLSSVFGGLAILTVSTVTYWGPNQQAANTTLGVLWVLTTIAGYVKARKHRYAEHREWMVRSFALCFSIILNRAWTTVCTVFLVSDGNDYAQLAQAIGVGSWLSWIVNLLVAEWWLQHTRVAKRVR